MLKHEGIRTTLGSESENTDTPYLTLLAPSPGITAVVILGRGLQGLEAPGQSRGWDGERLLFVL